MFKFVRQHLLAAVVFGIAGVVLLGGAAFAFSSVQTSHARVNAVSFIGTPSGGSHTLFSVADLTVTVSCDTKTGNPVITATTSAPAADIFGSATQMGGPTASYGNDAFSSSSQPVDLTAGLPGPDFDASGTMVFETGRSEVVSFAYGFDNPVTLNGPNGDTNCTVFGTVSASRNED